MTELVKDSPLIPFVWQQDYWNQLTEQHRSGRLPHALLLAGAQGIGKYHLARAMAAYLLCRQPGKTACGNCASCSLFYAGTHPDLMEVMPESEGKQIKIEQIRKLQTFANKTAQQGGFRVVILQPADAMNINAANALLKNLEEPGDNVLFILLSHRLNAVMATIKSRCQQFSLPVPDKELALDWLGRHLSSHGALHAEKLLRMAQGNPLLAQELADEALHKQRDKLFFAMENLTRGGDPVELAPGFIEGNLQWTLRWMQQWLNDWCRWMVTQDESDLSFPDMLPLYRQWQHSSDLEKARLLFQEVGYLRTQLLSGANPNIQLAMEALLIRWVDKMLL
ncbi:DNA polymerase III subunit delta' [Oceanospirillum linum]|uniref:DNA polymerase III subunit delta' n=1 Tax=Oceanospirillum linum TaxID=966 RepID=A0A1T1HET9_OCELI|nr:DNA polymerase III subunit delta' [Oceanospirillum linum]OOV88250.1 DNA polymerase III subunit delta' [Oceanospirillum linum]SEF49776.1 DNA polymerase III, delta prime subunit [Oleiphilus messinensis]SMP03648.1 DNA polymerase III, delta prime subunit [Oceanospirillum linum]